MSYILDALKKSEKERMRKSAPDILSVQETILHEKKKRNILKYLIIIALFANVFILGYWLFYSGYNKDFLKNSDSKSHKTIDINNQKVDQFAGNNINEEVNTTKQIASNDMPSPSTDKKLNIIDKSISFQDTKLKNKPENTQIQSTKSEKKESNNIYNKENSPNREKSFTHNSLPFNKEPVPDVNKLYSINELPSSVKDSLPPINMTIFMYSDDPASRMVRINGQTLREGQNISEGVRLEEIKADGIIVSYKNYKMHIGQKQ